jgi:hypothetical protein
VDTIYRYLKSEWRDLWERKIDDKLLAEAIARREYAVLFVDRGDVLWATRAFVPPDFYDVVERHEKLMGERIRPVDPMVGGWGKFIKDEILVPWARKRSRRRREGETRRRGSSEEGWTWLASFLIAEAPLRRREREVAPVDVLG